MVPAATMNADFFHHLAYTAGAGVDNYFQLAWDGTTYSFKDAAESINVTGAGAVYFSGSGTNAVSCANGYPVSISVDLGDGLNHMVLEGTGVPTTIANSSVGGIDDVVLGSMENSNSSTLANIQGTVPVSNPSGATILAIYDGGDTTARTVSMYDGSITGLAPATISWTPTSSSTGGVTSLGVSGGSGTDTYNIYNTSNLVYGTYLVTDASNIINFDYVHIQSTQGALEQGALAVDSGAATVSLLVGSNAVSGFGGTMANINGSIDLFSSTPVGSIAASLDDGGDTTGRTVSMYDGRLTGLSPAPILWTPTASSGGGVVGLSIDGGSGNNTWNIYATSKFRDFTWLFNGSGSNSVNVQSTSANGRAGLGYNSLYLDGGSGVQTVTIGSLAPTLGGTLANINGTVDVYNSNASGSSYLNIDDSGDTAGKTVSMSDGEISGLAPANIFWSDGSPSTGLGGVNLLNIFGSAAGSIYNVNDTSNFYYSTSLVTGGGSDTVNVNGTTGGLYVNNLGGQDSVYVGNGTLSAVNGFVAVYGAGATWLVVQDSGDTTARTGTLNSSSLSGLSTGTIYWVPSSASTGGVTYLAIYGPSAGSTYNVNDTSIFYYSTYLQTGGGSDTVNVNGTTGGLTVNNSGGQDSVFVGNGTLSAINGSVYVNGAGSTYLYVQDSNDSTARTGTLNSGSLSGLSNGTIYWAPTSASTGGVTFLDIFGSAAGSTYNVNDTSNFYLHTYLVTGGGSDTVNVNGTTGGLTVNNSGGQDSVFVGNGTLSAINGFVDVYGYGSGATWLYVQDSGDSTGRSATLTSSSLSGLAPAVIYYGTSVSSLNINGGSGNDTLTVSSTSASTPVTWNAGGGSNTLVGPNSNNTWNITATNAGNVGNVTFSSVQNLTAGSANDTFVFSNGMGVTGTINGGGGFDTLDYHLYATGVTVNLAASVATGTGHVTNVHNVVGSPFNDTITGDNASDVINLNGGKDIVTGGTGNDTFILGATQLAGTKVTGNGGIDTLVGANISNTWTISSANGGNVDGKVTFTGISNLVGGAGNDTYKFSGPSPSLSGTITDGGGTNKLDYSLYTGGGVSVNLANNAVTLVNGGAAGGFLGAFASVAGNTNPSNKLTAASNPINNWDITAKNGGKVNTFSFTNMPNLVGGSGVDIFKFANSLLDTVASIDGGGAPPHQGDWLDYSGFAAAVAVNLVTDKATNVTGSIHNIQNVHGGNSTTTLTGNSQGNILIGGSTGGGAITGGSGRSLLIADKGGAAIKSGSSAGDILIGDYTTFDTMTSANEAALASILAEWQSGDSYADRFGDINKGALYGPGSHLNGGSVLKWGTTVKDDPLPDAALTVTAASASGLDWFFVDSNDIAVNFVGGDHKDNT